MKFLLLNGHGINLRVDNAKLHIKDGFYSTKEKTKEYVYSPKRIDLDSVIIYGQDGNITIDAIRWLVKHHVQVTFLNWNGKLLTTMLPPESTHVKTKFEQYKAYQDYGLRLGISKKLISAKFERTKLVLEYLEKKYSQVKTGFEDESKRLNKCKSIPEVMMVEGRAASFYWQQLAKIFPEKFEFSTREYQKRPWGAGDQINCLLNYGYAILESECLRTINSCGLDAYVGFLHEQNKGKKPLAYDLQEPYRFLIDLAVISVIENDIFEKKDFIRTENYNLRLRPSGAKKLLTEIEKQFNKVVEFNGKSCSWHYIILTKTRELASFLMKRRKTIDFTEPTFELDVIDTKEIREKILLIPYSKAKDYGFSKGTLHYMKQNAKSNKPFTLNKHVKERLENLTKIKV